uniref:Uncharacterized protein n=1 Tax=Setaria italica TaxID=4555 RepID=K3YNK6_SETIT
MTNSELELRLLVVTEVCPAAVKTYFPLTVSMFNQHATNVCPSVIFFLMHAEHSQDE